MPCKEFTSTDEASAPRIGPEPEEAQPHGEERGGVHRRGDVLEVTLPELLKVVGQESSTCGPAGRMAKENSCPWVRKHRVRASDTRKMRPPSGKQDLRFVRGFIGPNLASN